MLATAASKLWLVTYGRASLNVKPPYRTPIIHCVECGHLVHAHRRHFQYAGNFIHNADTGEPVLTLPKIKQWHDGGLLVLTGISCDNLFDDLLVGGIELERNLWVVARTVSVL